MVIGDSDSDEPTSATVPFLSEENEILKVEYSFLGKSGTKAQRDKVNTVIKTWALYAHITFELVENSKMIRITFKRSEGSSSLVGEGGMAALAEEGTMNLAGVYETGGIAKELERGDILHEFGHALGLLHEHQSPERIKVNEKAVYKHFEVGRIRLLTLERI
ncbi:hypothetical protein B0H16DRAFT_1516824 [Mycena metata]|uniref:Peptidase metallopeptidase domain-containing protein n=1 Tax=Mycena metata TaxID=1033252 RepID=A0AAD7JQS7_9AGAR|nr:hypothetical protein B0H16DRAFT_1516824 [Mycena metata]